MTILEISGDYLRNPKIQMLDWKVLEKLFQCCKAILDQQKLQTWQ